MTDEAAHRFSREHGVNRAIYELVRVVLLPIVKVWYRFRVTGAEHIPKDGPLIVAPGDGHGVVRQEPTGRIHRALVRFLQAVG